MYTRLLSLGSCIEYISFKELDKFLSNLALNSIFWIKIVPQSILNSCFVWIKDQFIDLIAAVFFKSEIFRCLGYEFLGMQ